MVKLGLVIALVGSFGSGCTYIAEEVLGDMDFEKISLSDILREEYKKEYKESEPSRADLQKYGTEIRLKKGTGYLAEQAIKAINNSERNFVIDSIRNPGELEKLKSSLRDLIIIGVYASKDTRWERVAKFYDNYRQFEDDDKTDQDEGVHHGQRVTACYLYADMVVDNEKTIHGKGSNSYKYLKNQLERCLCLVTKPGSIPPSEDETLMAVAYANSQRSSCHKRRVGAIIVDSKGHILSSGYNEVPGTNSEPCLDKYGKCYRDKIKDDFAAKIRDYGFSDEDSRSIQKAMWEEFKILDRCRALHAEEQAILNLVRFGSRIPNEMTMYDSTAQIPCKSIF